MDDCVKKNRERKTVRFDPELQVVFVEAENEPDRVPGLSLQQSPVRQRVKVHQLALLRHSCSRQPQIRPLALPPKNEPDVLALIDQILEKPLEPSPPSSPSAVTPSSSSSLSPPPPPPPLSKQQPLPKSKLLLKPKPRANNSFSVTNRDLQRFRRDLAIVDGLSGSAGLARRCGKAAQPSRFFQPLCMHPHVPPMMAPSPPAQLRPQPSTTNAAAVALDLGQNTHGKPRALECQSEKGGDSSGEKHISTRGIPMAAELQRDKAGEGSDRKHKGRCMKRNGRCKKCDRAINRSQGDDGGRDNDHGCGMEFLHFTIQCMGCTIA
ncbi:transcription factor SOX-30-like [Rhopalosiphum padi]|uniref:transcription factor SOX-30-like n=1 Tax=Rhopalosiphum padi TaxID=40932 RepID=UPI00298DFC4A|nr:transcription factor SOX-30-like [Rhopalosiphum padi]